jgi:hypothetical protein
VCQREFCQKATTISIQMSDQDLPAISNDPIRADVRPQERP